VEYRTRERGVTLRKTRIGSPYVVSALAELCAGGNHTRIVGWESNGGFLTATDIALRTGTLAALPTRDSTLPILATLYAAAEQRIGLCTLWNRLPARFGRAGLIDNMPVEVSQAILTRIIPNRAITEVVFSENGSVIDRSGMNPAISELTPTAASEWQGCRSLLSRFFTPAVGFTEIVRINTLDGVRVYFANGDVAHLRPSGNAPQMRIYANSNSQGRADQIVELALREPDGILRQLERAFT
jgi:phosphomannomutase